MALTVMHSAEEWSSQFGPEARTALSVGNFDGLHLGHEKILQLLVARARRTAQRSLVVTFDPHPLHVLQPDQAPRMIQTLSQRLAGFERLGIDAAVVLHFDRALSLVSAEDFIQRILFEYLHVGAILVGANFRFGHRGAGDVQSLSDYGKSLGFDVEIVPPVEILGHVVSSSAIRNAIENGNLTEATTLLGRPFSLTGAIHPGEGRGRAILFPTLNLIPEQELLPKLGVYVSEAVLGEETYPSVTNVGMRPTFNGKGLTVESHLLGFDRQVTSGLLEVRFLARVRDEEKFSGPAALRDQIARDIEAAHKYFVERRVPEHTPRG